MALQSLNLLSLDNGSSKSRIVVKSSSLNPFSSRLVSPSMAIVHSFVFILLMSTLCCGEQLTESTEMPLNSESIKSNHHHQNSESVFIEKRSTGNQEGDNLPSEGGQSETLMLEPFDSLDDLEINEQFMDDSKRSPSRYSFGIGKRVNDLTDYDLNSFKRDNWNAYETIKRLPVSRYNFGIGKKSRYNFGIGKKSRYNFGLGKRMPSQRYSFGIGK